MVKSITQSPDCLPIYGAILNLAFTNLFSSFASRDCTEL